MTLGLVLLAPSPAAQKPPAHPQELGVPLDNQKARHLNFECGPIAPLLLSPDGSVLYALNQSGARAAVFETATMDLRREIAIGLGAVSIAQRPGKNELWIVDRVGSCISVVHPGLRTIVRTIRVGAEPHGIAFTDDGDRAYVTCSAVDRVDVIRTSDYAVVREIAIPAREPRGIVHVAGQTYVVSFRSGNNTAGRGRLAEPDAVVSVARLAEPGVQPLPDRDLFVIPKQPTPEQDALDPSATLTGLGTTLFNVHTRPGTSELWIPNTDALNAEHHSEANFVGGQVVQNRITIVDTSGATAPLVVDLDALAPLDRKCAQPSAVAFDPILPRAFVCGYGSDLVAVLQLGPGGEIGWLGSIGLPAKQVYPRGTGPRAALVDPQGRYLFVLDKVDGAVTKIDLQTLPATGGFHVVAPVPIALGFDPLSDEERLGRHLFANADFSRSKSSSCASCHVDGGTDGLVWDLSRYVEPEGTPDASLAFGLDVKGPLVTQSVRRLEESGPYHWRGDKHAVNDFNASFATLLDHTVGGAPADIDTDFQYLTHYLHRMAIPANPRQSLDRSFTPEELAGAQLFQNKPVFGSLTCADCHTLPLGGGGEVVALSAGGVPLAIDVPLLRGVGDKLSPEHAAGGAFGVCTELGAGLSHAGAFSGLVKISLRHTPQASPIGGFSLSPVEASAIARFLSAFDTGLAPATAFQATVYLDGTLLAGTSGLDFLLEQAGLGHCDVVCYRTPAPGGALSTAVYDPILDRFRVALANGTPLDVSALLAEAAGGKPVTFLGVPLGMGRTLGIDRDLDGLYDLDEISRGSSPETWDTDGDVFPDGYEVLWGMDPLAFDTSSPDQVPPALSGPPELVYATTNTLKFEFKTSEYTRVYLSYNGGPIVQRLPLHPADDELFAVLGGLEPDTPYTLTLLIEDLAHNVTTDSTTVFRTKARATPTPVHVREIAVTAGGAPATLDATVDLEEAPQVFPAGYTVFGSAYRLYWNGVIQELASALASTSDGSGRASFQITLPVATILGPSTLFFVVEDVRGPPGSAPYALGLNAAGTFATVAF